VLPAGSLTLSTTIADSYGASAVATTTATIAPYTPAVRSAHSNMHSISTTNASDQ
jgi:hypothetical protein